MPLTEGQMSGAAGREDPGRMARLVTPAGTDLPSGICRALNCLADGTIDFIDASGFAVTGYAVHKGYNPIGAQRISASTTTIWAIY